MYSKFHARKVKYNGITFDSKKEAGRYAELLILEKIGQIRDLRRQVKYVLIPAQKSADGKTLERECAYYADFVYFDPLENSEIVEDTKGVRTPEYIIKRKLMLERYKIRIREV